MLLAVVYKKSSKEHLKCSFSEQHPHNDAALARETQMDLAMHNNVALSSSLLSCLNELAAQLKKSEITSS
jgi:hypothetical protein